MQGAIWKGLARQHGDHAERRDEAEGDLTTLVDANQELGIGIEGGNARFIAEEREPTPVGTDGVVAVEDKEEEPEINDAELQVPTVEEMEQLRMSEKRDVEEAEHVTEEPQRKMPRMVGKIEMQRQLDAMTDSQFLYLDGPQCRYDLCEVFSPPRVAARARVAGQRGGGAWILPTPIPSRAKSGTCRGPRLRGGSMP